ncbi:hypothetical protein OG883_08455 [Streptomyces sp. NBC_01142]|uniref:hypothetical protein n=1 Tax=Streptomyces sp. NBC_01142 TaxID=2975865 RepID=UPI00224DF6F7|nr:hypothetical protein [Streptomyces sp. NBC_01142]MCX4819935.1 hypothetical protein [Streptomyces sp. NBC_01142]
MDDTISSRAGRADTGQVWPDPYGQRNTHVSWRAGTGTTAPGSVRQTLLSLVGAHLPELSEPAALQSATEAPHMALACEVRQAALRQHIR